MKSNPQEPAEHLHLFHYCIFITLFLFLFSAGVLAQQIYLSYASDYYFEFLKFKAGNGERTLLEVFAQLPTDDFQFVRNDKNYHARFEIGLSLYDPAQNRIAQVSLADSILSQTSDGGNVPPFRLLHFSFQVPPGELEACIYVKDLETGSERGFSKQIEIPDFRDSGLALSDLQLASSISRCEENSILVKNKRKVVPNVPRIFGSNFQTLYVYSEVYNLQELGGNKGEFTARFVIEDQFGKPIKKFRQTYDKLSSACALSVGIRVSDLESGSYRLIQSVRDPITGEVTQRASNFVVVQPLENLTESSFARMLRQLKYIASSRELKALRRLPVQERDHKLDEFWEKRNPTPGHSPNQFMVEYYKRVAFANRAFFSFLRDGWETDQGEIYIKNGPPDNVDRYADNTATTYEVWQYNRLNQKYIFIDRQGFGEFHTVSRQGSFDLDSPFLVSVPGDNIYLSQ